MAERLFVALYTDADVIHKSLNGEGHRSLICLFATPYLRTTASPTLRASQLTNPRS